MSSEYTRWKEGERERWVMKTESTTDTRPAPPYLGFWGIKSHISPTDKVLTALFCSGRSCPAISLKRDTQRDFLFKFRIKQTRERQKKATLYSVFLSAYTLLPYGCESKFKNIIYRINDVIILLLISWQPLQGFLKDISNIKQFIKKTLDVAITQ